jgi:sugar phosphate permease
MMKLRKVFYGWVIVGISALVFAVVRGVNDAFGVFFVAIVGEFGWSRAAVAGVYSCAQLTNGAVALGVGMLSDRVSVRHLVPLSACLIALGLVLASRAQSLSMLYLAYGLIFAVGYCGVGELAHIPVISRWFVTQRGTAIGVAMAGMGVGILFIVPLAQTCIHHL